MKTSHSIKLVSSYFAASGYNVFIDYYSWFLTQHRDDAKNTDIEIQMSMMWSNPMPKTIRKQVYLPGPKQTGNKTGISAVADK